MRIGRMHPVCNWLRCQGDDYNLSMEKVLSFRDEAMLQDPSSSGLPPAALAWFWTEQLPRLIQHPHYRRQAEEHLASLRLKSTDLSEMVERVAGGLLNEQAETDHLADQIQTLLNTTNDA